MYVYPINFTYRRFIRRFTLRNSHDVLVRILDYGGTITDIIVPDKHGNMDDINLGFDSMEGTVIVGL